MFTHFHIGLATSTMILKMPRCKLDEDGDAADILKKVIKYHEPKTRFTTYENLVALKDINLFA